MDARSDFIQRHWRALILPGLLALAVLWAAFAPVRAGASRDMLFEIPKGAAARRHAGDQVAIVPSAVRLTLGVHDVLLLRNKDTVPQVFGPVLLMPGQDFRLPFAQVSEHHYACTALAGGRVTVVVDALPYPGLGRLLWRLREWSNALRRFEWIPPKH